MFSLCLDHAFRKESCGRKTGLPAKWYGSHGRLCIGDFALVSGEVIQSTNSCYAIILARDTVALAWQEREPRTALILLSMCRTLFSGP